MSRRWLRALLLGLPLAFVLLLFSAPVAEASGCGFYLSDLKHSLEGCMHTGYAQGIATGVVGGLVGGTLASALARAMAAGAQADAGAGSGAEKRASEAEDDQAGPGARERVPPACREVFDRLESARTAVAQRRLLIAQLAREYQEAQADLGKLIDDYSLRLGHDLARSLGGMLRGLAGTAGPQPFIPGTTETYGDKRDRKPAAEQEPHPERAAGEPTKKEAAPPQSAAAAGSTLAAGLREAAAQAGKKWEDLFGEQITPEALAEKLVRLQLKTTGAQARLQAAETEREQARAELISLQQQLEDCIAQHKLIPPPD